MPILANRPARSMALRTVLGFPKKIFCFKKENCFFFLAVIEVLKKDVDLVEMRISQQKSKPENINKVDQNGRPCVLSNSQTPSGDLCPDLCCPQCESDLMKAKNSKLSNSGRQ